MGTTVDVLGESVTAEADARAAAARYVALLDALAAEGLDRNVSLKPSQMGLAVDPALARENIAAIVAKAVETGAFVRIDMEDHPTTDATLALWHAVRPVGATEAGTSGADVGVVIQAALRRSDADVEAIIGAGGRVRLCKGAYKEPSSVAYADKAEVDEAYERLMLRLMRAGRYPALATHDVRLIRRAVEVAKAEGIARDAFEFQMLYGIRRDLQEQLAGAGWRVRVYVPFGGAVVPVLHAPPRGATGQRVVPAAQHVAGSRPALTRPGIQEPPVRSPGGSCLGGGHITELIWWAGYQRRLASITRNPAAIVPRNIVARYAYHLNVDFIPVSLPC